MDNRRTSEEVICGLSRSQYEQKHAKIIKCAMRPDSDDRLRRMAMKDGGLLTNKLRRLVWPKLLNISCDSADFARSIKIPAASELESHRDYRQVKLDVHRSVRRFPPGLGDKQRGVVERQIVKIIVTVLCQNPHLHYYQGFNDVCAVFHFVGGESFAIAALQQLGKSHLKEFLKPTMEQTSLVLSCLYPLVGYVSSKLKKHLERSEVGTIFALSWILTWFSHDVDKVELMLRIFDVTLATHKFFPLYLSASILLYCGTEVLCTPGDISHIHPYLSRIPTIGHLPWEILISRALTLFLHHPPSTFAPLFRSQEEQIALEQKNRRVSSTSRATVQETTRSQIQAEYKRQLQIV